jgi:hypothetical protein
LVEEAGLIALERENVIRFFLDDASGDRLLRPHRVDGDDRSFEREHVEEFGDRGDFVGFAIDGALRQHEPGPRGVGGDEMQRAGPVGLSRAAQPFAVHGDDFARLRAKRRRPSGKTLLQRRRIEQPKHFPQGLGARDALFEGQELAQPAERAMGNFLNAFPIVASADDADERR